MSEIHHGPKSPAPRNLLLTGSDLDIWTASLSGSPEQLAYFDSLLSADEKARSGRFYFERDRDRYIFGRGILRTLLASYLHMDASDIAIVYGQINKPRLEPLKSESNLQFNVAHSNDWAAYIFGWDRPVGIDLESVHPVTDVDDLVRRFFSARESRLIHSLSGAAKWDTFFKIWTCKEALLKAQGSGLTVPLDRFEISFEENERVALTSDSGDAVDLAAWHLQIVELVTGYRSAIAAQGNIGRVVFHDFQT